MEIETSLRYAYSYFNRSTANRKELQTVGRFRSLSYPKLSLRNTMALQLSRDEGALAGSQCCGWVPTDNYQWKASHEGRCILQMLVEHADGFKGTLDVMCITFYSPPACKPGTSPSGPCTSISSFRAARPEDSEEATFAEWAARPMRGSWVDPTPMPIEHSKKEELDMCRMKKFAKHCGYAS